MDDGNKILTTLPTLHCGFLAGVIVRGLGLRVGMAVFGWLHQARLYASLAVQQPKGNCNFALFKIILAAVNDSS